MFKTEIAFLAATAALCFPAPVLGAQAPQTPASSLTGRTIKAIGYQVNSGSTTVDLKSTGLLPGVTGKAEVEAKSTVTRVEAWVEGLRPPTALGTEFLTYVLWAVSPEGHAVNLGGIPFDNNGRGKLKATTNLQSFSLFVTAEPYSAVRQPSEMLALENEIRNSTKGKIFLVNNYQLMKRSEYEKLGNPLALTLDLKNVPLEMYEARNAVDIAHSRGADRYAPDVFAKAQAGLEQAERALSRKADRKQIISLARQTTQFAEDARALTASARKKNALLPSGPLLLPKPKRRPKPRRPLRLPRPSVKPMRKPSVRRKRPPPAKRH